MKKGEASKAKIVEAAGELFWKHGYAATGIRDILDATGLPKGSFYFYFKSKSDVAREVIGYYSRVIIDVLKDTAELADSWEAFCDAFLCVFEEKLKDKQYYGCPLAVLGMELAFQEELAESYWEAMDQVRAIFFQVLQKSGVSGEKLEAAADFALTVYEGNLLLYRISRDQNQLEKMKYQMKQIVREKE